MARKRSTQGNHPREPGEKAPGKRPPTPVFYRYCLAEGWEILAGRNDRDNELLTGRTAGPNDYWFHVRGMPGSHVILRHGALEDAERDILRAAAAVAAYHSKARGGGTVAVSCTRAKYVRKPRGAKDGTVAIRKETVLKVSPELPSPPG